jgi:hypothetical protein
MKTYIQAHGFEIWQSIVYGYTTPVVLPTNDKAVKLGQNNSKAKNTLLNGLSETIFTKFAHCKSAKQIWDKLQNIYEGVSKVKAAKLQTYIGQFEQLKMKVLGMCYILCMCVCGRVRYDNSSDDPSSRYFCVVCARCFPRGIPGGVGMPPWLRATFGEAP